MTMRLQTNDPTWWRAADQALVTGEIFAPGSPFFDSLGFAIDTGMVSVLSSYVSEFGERVRRRATLRHDYVMPGYLGLPTMESEAVEVVGEWDLADAPFPRTTNNPTPET